MRNSGESGEFEFVTSRAQLDEQRRVLTYPKMRLFVSREEARLLLETLDTRAQITEDLSESSAVERAA